MNNHLFDIIKFRLIGGLLASFVLICRPVSAETLLTSLDFESGSFADGGGWDFGFQQGAKMDVVSDRTQTAGASAGSLRAYYPISIGKGAVYNWATFDLTKFNTREIYVEFDVKIPGATESIKFFKVFGQSKTGEVANTTFGITGDPSIKGSLHYIGFGDGTIMDNDVNNIIFLSGEEPKLIGRSYGKANVYTIGHDFRSTDWKQDWHHFRIHVKFNTATYDYTAKKCISETNDGAYYLEIDGVKYVDAKGLYNRHCINLPIERINFFDWGDGGVSAFTVWLDNVKVTTGGFSTSATNPSNVQAPTSNVSAPLPLSIIKITAP